jgi:hypothetical protein
MAESGFPTSRSIRPRASSTSGFAADWVPALCRSASSATSSRMLTRCASAVFDSSTSPCTKPGSTSAERA